MKKKVSLRDMIEDDNSPYMRELCEKFEAKYGKELDDIITESKRIGAPVSSRMGINRRSHDRHNARRL